MQLFSDNVNDKKSQESLKTKEKGKMFIFGMYPKNFLSKLSSNNKLINAKCENTAKYLCVELPNIENLIFY